MPGPPPVFSPSSRVVVQKHSSDETEPEGKHATRAHCRQKETVIQPVLTPCFHSWSEEEGAESRSESVGSSGNSLRLDLCLLIRGGFLGVLFTAIVAMFFSFFLLRHTFLRFLFFFSFFLVSFWQEKKRKKSKAGPSSPVSVLPPRRRAALCRLQLHLWLIKGGCLRMCLRW